MTSGDETKAFATPSTSVATAASAAANTAIAELAYTRFGPTSAYRREHGGAPFHGRRLQCDLGHLEAAVNRSSSGSNVTEKRHELVRAICDADIASTVHHQGGIH